MGRNKHFKFMNFLNILGEAEIHGFPKTWVKWISKVRNNYGKTRTFQIYRFFKCFGLNRNPYNSQNMGVKQKSLQFPKYRKSEFT